MNSSSFSTNVSNTFATSSLNLKKQTKIFAENFSLIQTNFVDVGFWLTKPTFPFPPLRWWPCLWAWGQPYCPTRTYECSSCVLHWNHTHWKCHPTTRRQKQFITNTDEDKRTKSKGINHKPHELHLNCSMSSRWLKSKVWIPYLSLQGWIWSAFNNLLWHVLFDDAGIN